ncbi:MAG: NAD-binding protein [Terriglobales bacterium]
MQHHIDQLTGHHIVCGLGDTGRYAVAELQKTNTPHVVVDISEENIRKLKELHPGTLQEMKFFRDF